MKCNIVLLNGSPNKEGNTAYILNGLSQVINELGASSEIVNINDALLKLKVPFCVSCSNPCNQSCYKNTQFYEIIQKAVAADGIVFGSPVYFGSMTAQLKAFFDKCRYIRNEKQFLEKPGCAVSVGATKYGGQENTVRAIHDCMLVLGMTVVSDGSIGMECGHFGACGQKPACNDEYTNKRIKVLANRIVREAQKNMNFES